MPASIFISYRRDDDASAAARVRDGLVGKFGHRNVFMDVDHLLAGQRFDEELAKALAQCDVLVAVIGVRWMDLLAARQASGERDYVREEIAEALRRRVVVIPVRVGREGQMPALPRPDDLPEDIRDLVHYQKHDVAHERFRRDVDDLAGAIRAVRKAGGRSAARGAPAGLWLAAAVGLLTATGVGAYYAGIPLPGLTRADGGAALRAAAVADERARADRETKRLAALDERRLRAAEEERRKAEAAEAKRKAEEVERAREGQRQAALKAEADRLRAAEEERRKAEADARKRDPALAVKPGSGQSFRDCPTCPEMMVVPAGSFTMGSPANEVDRSSDEGPQRKVSIGRPFAVGKFEVTFAEWDACVADRGCTHKPADQGWGRGKRPVINVSWDDAKQYAAWLSRKTGQSYRLLTEAEWEYAARAGTTTPFSTGRTITTAQANFDGNYTYGGSAKGQFRQRTIDVGSFKPNAFGLHDMHGNVWEWVEDCYVGNYNGAPVDGSARGVSGNCVSRVLRGGSWIVIPQFLRAADRNYGPPGIRNSNVGFRLARTLLPSP